MPFLIIIKGDFDIPHDAGQAFYEMILDRGKTCEIVESDGGVLKEERSVDHGPRGA